MCQAMPRRGETHHLGKAPSVVYALQALRRMELLEAALERLGDSAAPLHPEQAASEEAARSEVRAAEAAVELRRR